MERDLRKFAMPCVILSGRISQRMGILKQNILFSDSTLAIFQTKCLKECFKRVYFSATTPAHKAFSVETILGVYWFSALDCIKMQNLNTQQAHQKTRRIKG